MQEEQERHTGDDDPADYPVVKPQTLRGKRSIVATVIDVPKFGMRTHWSVERATAASASHIDSRS